MGYLFETELREQAEEFINSLEKDEIQGSIAQDGFRNYMVKINITRGQKFFGNINLYYSLNKNSFSLKTHELIDKSIIPDIEAAWAHFFYGNQIPKEPSISSEMVTTSWEYEAYVDGSFVDGPVGYGTLILKSGKSVYEISATVQNPELLDMHQVGGELQAVYTAIEWCQNNHIPGISIFYDYEGIERWATGSWKANNPATKAYVSFIRDCGIQINWNKIKSHSGNPWNEYVDRLAKQGSQRSKTASSNASNQLNSIHKKAQEFISFLRNENITATVVGIMNGQFVRILVQPQGQMDIYCTRKRTPEEPYLSNFSDTQLKKRFEQLWQSFYLGEIISIEAPPPQSPFLNEVEYLYRILAPYRDCWFDFSDLAKALEQACNRLGYVENSAKVIGMANDFYALETIYHELTNAKG